MEAVVEGKEWNLTARTDGSVVRTVDARSLLKDIAEASWQCADPGVQYDTTINAWHTSPNTGRINASNPCSEYMHIDDSACNLSSLNLMKFRKEDGEFDVPMFEHAVDVMFLAQEIIVGYSSYPTPEIGRNALKFRQLGLGFANLGALLMARGLPYDSDEGRAYAAAITAIMTGRAYRKSAEVAKRMGPHAGYAENAAAMLGVISKHRAAVGNIQHTDSVPADMLSAARKAWDDALDLGEVAGFRNAQATVLAPTGTISFMMDCDTTGVEPDFSLVKSKKLVGGGELTIVNKTVPMALGELGYATREVEEIVAYIDERGNVIGAPHLKQEHYPVFDCAIGERAIHYMGHVKMMGAVQPFISGAISKTVNLPEKTSVDEVSQLLIEAWQLGVKAIAIYRDNCKVAQPLSGSKDTSEEGRIAQIHALGGVVAAPKRRRLPDDRTEVGRKFKVGEYEGYIHVGLFEDGTPGDIFVDIAKEGTTLAGLMNSFMISVSLGLQYGVPLEVYVSKFSHMRFEPSGLTNDADIRVAKSIVDYIFRWMGKKFLSADQQEEAGILTPEVKARLAAAYAAGEAAPASHEAPPTGQTALFNSWEDAVECSKCGGRMVRTGSCYTCRDCGTNTGCSLRLTPNLACVGPSARAARSRRPTLLGVAQVLVHEGDRHAALADRCRYPLHGAEPDVAAGEDARDARLEEVRVPFEWPPSGVAHVTAGEHIALEVERDLRWEPRGLGIGADEDEQAARLEPRRLAADCVMNVDRLERGVAVGGRDLVPEQDSDVRAGCGLVDEILRHALLQRVAAVDDRDRAGVGREEDGRLPRPVAGTDDVDVEPVRVRCFAARGTVEDPLAD